MSLHLEPVPGFLESKEMKTKIPRLAIVDGTTPEPRVRELLEMLRYCRPSGGVTERKFINRFLKPLGTHADKAGNHWLIVGDRPSILWSSHTDTVHKEEGKQPVIYGDGWVSTEKSSCLGADCTVGVWIMIQMIRARVPGIYAFHANEEIGGLGSAHVAKKTPEFLSGVQCAIAFDRMGTNEIITHQFQGRCASDAFAYSLAQALAPLDYIPSDKGSFTDTANYRGLVPECTNIGVGYYKQHQKTEWLDVGHACQLLDTILAADFSRLIIERDHTKPDDDEWGESGRWWTDAAYDRKDTWEGRDQTSFGGLDTKLSSYVLGCPDEVTAFLELQGYTVDEIERELREAGILPNA